MYLTILLKMMKRKTPKEAAQETGSTFETSLIDDDTMVGLDACYLSSTDVMEAISSGYYGQAMNLAKQAGYVKQEINSTGTHTRIFSRRISTCEKTLLNSNLLRRKR